MKIVEKIPANFTLTQNEEACEQIQRGNFKLEVIATTTDIENNKSVSKNKAVFEGVHSTQVLNELTFVEVGDKKPAEIIEEKKKEGLTPICDSEIFVENKLTRILVFGKKV